MSRTRLMNESCHIRISHLTHERLGRRSADWKYKCLHMNGVHSNTMHAMPCSIQESCIFDNCCIYENSRFDNILVYNKTYVVSIYSCSHALSVYQNMNESHHIRMSHNIVQPIPFGVTSSNAVSKLKAQSLNVSFATFQRKEPFEL